MAFTDLYQISLTGPDRKILYKRVTIVKQRMTVINTYVYGFSTKWTPPSSCKSICDIITQLKKKGLISDSLYVLFHPRPREAFVACSYNAVVRVRRRDNNDPTGRFF